MTILQSILAISIMMAPLLLMLSPKIYENTIPSNCYFYGYIIGLIVAVNLIEWFG